MIPFTGETMTCAICKCEQKSDPQVESNWRMIKLDGVGFYVCTKHFPKDGASAKQFEKAYVKVIKRLMQLKQAARYN